MENNEPLLRVSLYRKEMLRPTRMRNRQAKTKLTIYILAIILAHISYATETFKSMFSLLDHDFYVIPSNRAGTSGEFYKYSNKKCYKHWFADNNIFYEEAACSQDLLDKALEPYTKIADFDQFKEQFLKCLEANNWKCLKPLIDRNIRFTNGVPDIGDQRDQAYHHWANLPGGLKKIAKIIGENKISEDSPSKRTLYVKDGYSGWYVLFELRDGGWRIIKLL